MPCIQREDLHLPWATTCFSRGLISWDLLKLPGKPSDPVELQRIAER